MKRRIVLATAVLTLSIPLGASAPQEAPAASTGDGSEAAESAPAVEEFVPSVRLPADTAVSFPVDI